MATAIRLSTLSRSGFGFRHISDWFPILVLVNCENEDILLGAGIPEFHPRPDVPIEVPEFIA